jgi:hypothetical protein
MLNVRTESSLKGIDRSLDLDLPEKAKVYEFVHEDPVIPTTGLWKTNTRLEGAAKRWAVDQTPRLESQVFPETEPAFPLRFFGDGTRREYRESITGWKE